MTCRIDFLWCCFPIFLDLLKSWLKMFERARQHTTEKSPDHFSSEIPCVFWTYKISDDMEKKYECRQIYLINSESFRVLYWSHSWKLGLPDTDFPHLYFFNECLIWAIWDSYCFIRTKGKKCDTLIGILDASGKINPMALFCHEADRVQPPMLSWPGPI